MNTPFLQVFTAKIPNYKDEPIYPLARQQEIAAVKSEKTRAEKYGVWKLLQYAVEKTFSRPFDDFVFTKNENGKWVCEEFYFSLSHSKNAVAVALSSLPVGVDIQKNEPLRDIKIASKILTDTELETAKNLLKNEMNAYLVGIWTKKEVAFKRGDEKIFTPKTIELNDTEVLMKTKIEDEEYFFAVSSNLLPLLSIYENVTL
jgi:phosphopantetheinyl transferase